MIEFTKEEKDFLKEVLLSVPIQGNIQTLPAMLNKVANILTKLDEEIKTKEEQKYEAMPSKKS